jgi:hypothetical protein
MTMCTGVEPVETGGLSVAVTEMVTGLGPQLNVMIPPPLTAVDRAWKVQLAGVPDPTVVVGWLVSTACACVGSVSVLQEPLGFPAEKDEPASPEASLDASLEEPASWDPASELPPLLAEPELDPLLLPLPPLLPLPLDPASVDAPPLEEPASLDPVPELPPVEPEVDPELDALPLEPAPLDDPPYPDALPLDPVPLLDPPLEASSPPEPDCPLLLQPIPSAMATNDESNARSARMVSSLSTRPALDATGDRRSVPRA